MAIMNVAVKSGCVIDCSGGAGTGMSNGYNQGQGLIR